MNSPTFLKPGLTRWIAALALVLLLVGTTSPVLAATRYVAPGGSDNGTCADPGAPCATLTYTIAKASSGDTITLAPGTYTEAGITIDKAITITGAGATRTIIQAAETPSTASSRIFVILSGNTVTINDLTLRHGDAGSSNGGAISNSGLLTLNRSIIRDNEANNGGAIYNDAGNATINQSAIIYNTSSFGGGGIHNRDNGVVTLNHTTISNNNSINYGGGIRNFQGNVYLNHCTVTANYVHGSGGGIYADSGQTNEVKNSIVAGNTAVQSFDDCGGAAYPVSEGYNLETLGGGCEFDQTSDQVVTDLLLGPLTESGADGLGNTLAHIPLVGSPALDAIPVGENGCGGDYTLDQRGYARPANDSCDIGDIELQTNETANAADSLTAYTPETLPGTGVTFRPAGGVPDLVYAHKIAQAPGGGITSGEASLHWWLHATGTWDSLDVNLCYSDDDIANVSDESSLRPYRWDGSAWQPFGGTFSVNESTNCVNLRDVTALSAWALAGDGQAPTALVIQGVRAQTGLTLVLGGLLALGVLGVNKRR